MALQARVHLVCVQASNFELSIGDSLAPLVCAPSGLYIFGCWLRQSWAWRHILVHLSLACTLKAGLWTACRATPCPFHLLYLPVWLYHCRRRRILWMRIEVDSIEFFWSLVKAFCCSGCHANSIAIEVDEVECPLHWGSVWTLRGRWRSPGIGEHRLCHLVVRCAALLWF